MIDGIERNRQTIKALFSGYDRPIKSSNNDLFNQIKDYLEGETAGKGIIRSIGNNLYFRSLIITVYKDGYIMRDDTHDKYFEGDTFEEFKDDYWKWVNPF